MGKLFENYGKIRKLRNFRKFRENYGKSTGKLLENYGKITGQFLENYEKIIGKLRNFQKQYENYGKITGKSGKIPGNAWKVIENYWKIPDKFRIGKVREIFPEFSCTVPRWSPSVSCCWRARREFVDATRQSQHDWGNVIDESTLLMSSWVVELTRLMLTVMGGWFNCVARHTSPHKAHVPFEIVSALLFYTFRASGLRNCHGFGSGCNLGRGFVFFIFLSGRRPVIFR